MSSDVVYRGGACRMMAGRLIGCMIRMIKSVVRMIRMMNHWLSEMYDKNDALTG